MNQNFKFSLILVVYNVEKYLNDAIESIINQDIGFNENIQLIIINDGSTDNSQDIIDKYVKKYPKNVISFNNNHEGLAYSRNFGLNHVDGEYVTFFDGDDKLSENALSAAYEFFEANNDINIVSFPIKFFEKYENDSKLNVKSSSENIIDLNKYANNPLLSISSCIIKYDSIANNRFSTDLIYGEDSLLLNKLLLKDYNYAFISDAEYYHRLRTNLNNISYQVLFKKGFYTERLKNFHLDLIKYSLSSDGRVPKFIQYTIIYDLLSLIKQPELTIFDDESEKKEFFNVLSEILDYIDDDDVVLNNRFIDDDALKSFIFYLKYGNINYELHPFNVTMKFNDFIADNLNSHRFWLDEIKIKDDYLHIKGFLNSLFNINDISIVAVKEKNGKYDFSSAAYINESIHSNTKFLSKTILYSYDFHLKIPTKDLEGSNFRLRVDFHKNGDKFDNHRDNLIFSYLPISFTYSSKLSDYFFITDGNISVSLDEKIFHVKKSFKFSVIMAVYNTENYVEKAIDSVINQTLDFKNNIQLILVNDGSTDSTEEILSNYKNQYPDNIVLINQINQGQASARNNGLNHVNAKYVNFLDSDDYLSDNVMEEVYKFFEKNESTVDVVSIPLVMFGRSSEKHLLDYKFNKTRVIDLTKEPNNPQLHVSSSFIKFESIKNNKFPTNITGSEDGNFVSNILLYKQKLGVVNKGVYFYRKRPDETSTLDTMLLKESFYIPRLKNHFMNLIDNSITRYGKVPKFIQYGIIYDLQWLLSLSKLEVYTGKSDINEFWNYINTIISYIDLNVITKNKNINSEYLRNFLIYLKKKNLHHEINDDVILLKAGDYPLDELNVHKIWLDIVEIDNGFLNISGFINTFFNSKYLSINAIKQVGANIEEYTGQYVEYSLRKGVKFLDKQWLYSFTFDLKIPLKDNEISKINIFLNYHCDGDNTNFKKYNVIKLNLDLTFMGHARISEFSNYIIKGNQILYLEDNSFNIIPYSYKSLIDLEKNVRNIFEEEKPDKFRSFLRFRLIYLMLYPFMRNKKIYLFMDRVENADDNAEHLFKHAVSQNDSIKKYFVLSKKSDDFSRVSKIGKVLKFNSFKHRLLYLFADKIISSHPDEFILNPFYSNEEQKDQRRYFNGLVTSKTYFLQHGVTKDNVSKWLKKYDKNLKLILTVSDEENKSFLDEGYNYDENIIQTLGFPRFDRLKSNPKNKILIIPTWRNYLEGNKSVFLNSDYFKSLNSLINDERLISLCKKNGYEIIFKAHPKLNTQISEEDDIKYIDLFSFNENIKLSTDESYQELFEMGSLLITDYSSVFFDFSYLKKPVIYYQPNDDYHHEKSYFVYEEMGFGDVIKNQDDLIKRIELYIENGCEMNLIYKNNVDNFFKYIDRNNCERVYNWILKN